VLEFNTRFGDPETQAVLPGLRPTSSPSCGRPRGARFGGMRIELRAGCAICVVISASGYPGSYATGELIWIPPALPDGVAVLHSGTGPGRGRALVTAGGRVLGVTAGGGDAARGVRQGIRGVRLHPLRVEILSP